MTGLPLSDLADTLARVLHPEYNVVPLADAILAVDKLLAQIEEARMWARHGYEIGQRSNTWTDHGVAPTWLAENQPSTQPAEAGPDDGFRWHVLSACSNEAACPIHGRDEEPAVEGSEDGVDLPELTAEDAVEAMQDMATDLYTAEDRLAFIAEMCDTADRAGEQITTERVRSWLAYQGCGGAIVLPDDVQEQLAAKLTLPQAMELHRATGRIIDQAQRERWTAAGRCGTCGFDGDRTGCHDCDGGNGS